MILWLNGPFGIGKTATAHNICDSSTSWRLFDPEYVGHMLRVNLQDYGFDDFQDLPPWRSLVPRVMHDVESFTGTSLVAVQTVLVEGYWFELRGNMADLGLDVFHVVLDCEPDVLLERIEADEVERDAREWRIKQLDAFESAKPWMTKAADLTVDTTATQADQVAATILEAVP